MSWEEDAVTRLDQLLTRVDSLRYDGTTSSIALYSAWSVQAKFALESLLGRDHSYATEFSLAWDYDAGPQTAVEILRCVRSDIENGYLRRVANIISAEIFDDFLEMARHLLDQGFKDPGASLCGAVLEDGLRRISRNHGLKINDRDDLNSLRDKCVQASIFNNLVRQQITAWSTLRNAADHGKFDEYNIDQVKLMREGIVSFLGSHLG